MADISQKLQEVRDLVEFLEGERQSVDDETFKQISEWILPQRGFWPADADTKSAVLERGKKNINPAAKLAVERAAGGMTTGMTPEGQPWFGFGVAHKPVMEQPGVRGFFYQGEQLLYTCLRAGGFYEAIHLCNEELVAFGNMLIFQDSSPKTVMRFECCTCGTYAIALDAERNLDTVVRRMRWTVKYIAGKYGEKKLSRRSRELLDKSPYTKIDVVHVVRPNGNFDLDRIDNLSMRFESILFEDVVGDDGPSDVINISGYHEMPYHFTGWSPSACSDYSIGPGHDVLGHTKQLQEEERQKLLGLQLMVNPAMRKPSSFKGRLNTGPGGQNIISDTDKMAVGPLFEVNVRLNELFQEIQGVEARVAAVAKADLFYDLPNEMRPKDMTATEYMERKRERMQLIAPVISIYEPRILDKVIERGYSMLDRIGLLPPPPPALQQLGRIEIEYVSTVAKALRQVGAESTRALLVDVAQMAQTQAAAGIKPTVMYKVDLNQAVDEIADGLGTPARIVRDDKEVARLMAEDDQKQQQAMQAQQQAMAMEQAAKLGNVSTEGTLAGKMMEGQS